jgi:hypothetical protein
MIQEIARVVITPSHLSGAKVVDVMPPLNPGHDAPDDTTLVLDWKNRHGQMTVGNLDSTTAYMTEGQLSRFRAARLALPEKCINTSEDLRICLKAAGVDLCT